MGQGVASDLTPALLEAGSRRPDAQGLDIEWLPAAEEDLPFENGSFDLVLSCIGVMFAPYHQVAADSSSASAVPAARSAAQLDT